MSRTKFTPPSAEEIFLYCYSKGKKIDPQKVIDFYTDVDNPNRWRDSNDRTIKNWKLKLTQVWFNRLPSVVPPEDAPKGWEFWYARGEDGNYYIPDSWKNGYPRSNEGYLTDRILKEAFERDSKKISKTRS